MNNQFKILDCTLRDGGYYNDWDFTTDTLENYLKCIGESGISIAELGLRSLEKSQSFLGPLAFTSDEFINNFTLPEKVKLAVMINAKEFNENRQKKIGQLFKESSKSPIKVVRIAADVDQIDICESLSKMLLQLGYEVFINLMKCGNVPLEQVRIASKRIKSWNSCSVVYFADSFGNMDASQVKEMSSILLRDWSDIGFHAHNNKLQALENVRMAISSGCKYIDSTITGMGRGAGNAQTEFVLLEYSKSFPNQFNPQAILPFIEKYMAPLQRKFNWGPNPFYFYGADKKVHPTYIQNLLQLDSVDSKRIFAAIDYLSQNNGDVFTLKSMNSALDPNPKAQTKPIDHKLHALNLKEKSVLIVADTEGTRNHQIGLRSYIERTKPFVITLNSNSILPSSSVDLNTICNPIRLATLDVAQAKSVRLLCPNKSLIANELRENAIEFDLEIEKGEISYTNNGCVLDQPLVLFYAILFSISRGATKIYLAGLDGHSKSEKLRIDVALQFEKLKKITATTIEVSAVTPTPYNISQRSIYEYNL